jgi:hypothetical protein
MPNPQAPPAPVPADLPSAKQQLRRRQAGQAELAQAARRAAQQLQQRFRRAPQTPQEGKMRTRTSKGVRHAPAPPRTSPKPVGPTASGETPSLSQTRPAASICRIDGSDRRALPRLTGESRGPGTPWTSPSAADNVVQRRRPVFPTGATPPTTPCSRRTTPRKRPLPQWQVVEGMHSSRTFSRHDRQVEPRPKIHIHAPTATTALPHQACPPPAAPPRANDDRSSGRPTVPRRDTSPAAPTPEGETNPYGETCPPVCPTRRDTSGLGSKTNPLPGLMAPRRVTLPQDDGRCSARLETWYRRIFFQLSDRPPTAEPRSGAS